MNKQRRLFLFGAACLVVLAAAAWLVICMQSVDNPMAYIYQHGELLYTMALTPDTKREILLTSHAGKTNTVVIQNGEIGIIHAECPDQICVRTGWIHNSIVPIICLPNQVEIRVKGGEPDSVVDGVAR